MVPGKRLRDEDSGQEAPQRQELLIEFRAPHRLSSRSIAQQVVEEYYVIQLNPEMLSH
jgi:hypothetical protein